MINEPAFPNKGYTHDELMKFEIEPERGLTKREYFAAMALQGLISGFSHDTQSMAQNAVEYADALIKELEK